jgi:hypothetical protein
MTEFLLFLSVVANAALVYYAYTERASRLGFERRAEIERFILRQAMYSRGRVSAVEVAARSPFALALVEAKLREMAAENQCLSDLDEQGRAVYVFPQFDDSAERRGALEREILLTARRYGGELSVEELAMETNLTLDESRAWLSAMAARGACAEAGERYRFERLARGA